VARDLHRRARPGELLASCRASHWGPEETFDEIPDGQRRRPALTLELADMR
jgi:hypothetical protein